MSVFLFTDFGAADIYVGQVKAVLQRDAPGVAVIDLLHEAPPYNVRAGAHLLAALSAQIPRASVTLAVVDPGVGSARGALAVKADGRWFVGPDNGLLSVLAAPSDAREYWRITWRPDNLSASFHGRDLFAPVAAAIQASRFPGAKAEPISDPDVDLGGTEMGEIIYIDHYGNAFTGLRARGIPTEASLISGAHSLHYHRVFSDARPGAVFWYENSLGLVEIAGAQCSAAAELDLNVGQPVGIAI
jgi:S-adenosylmethionine hydrolase